MVIRLGETLRDELLYYAQFEGEHERMIQQEIRQALNIFSAAMNIARQYQDQEAVEALTAMQKEFSDKI